MVVYEQQLILSFSITRAPEAFHMKVPATPHLWEGGEDVSRCPGTLNIENTDSLVTRQSRLMIGSVVQVDYVIAGWIGQFR